MFDNIALDVVIGLVFIYLLYSLLATIVQEIIASTFSLRAKKLKQAIGRMLEDHSLVTRDFITAYYDHPMVKYLGANTKSKTASYFKSETFSKVVIDLLKGNKNLQPGIDIRPLIQKAIADKQFEWITTRKINDETALYLQSIWAEAQGDIDRFKALLENWFDETMDRATGWYKKYTQRILFFIGLSLALIFNIDTINIIHKLEKDPDLRAQVVQQADAFVKAHPDLDKQLEQAKNKNTVKAVPDSLQKDSLQETKSPDSLALLQRQRDSLLNLAKQLVNGDIKKINNVMGLGYDNWNENHINGWAFLFYTILGWIITALAISLGAPFWFDILNKVMQARSSVAPQSGDKNKNTDGGKASVINRKG